MIQVPIVAIVVWVIFKMMKSAHDERQLFMTTMKERDNLFTSALASERESRDKTLTKTMESLASLAVAITELRGEVRFNHLAMQRDTGKGGAAAR